MSRQSQYICEDCDCAWVGYEDEPEPCPDCGSPNVQWSTDNEDYDYDEAGE